MELTIKRKERTALVLVAGGLTGAELDDELFELVKLVTGLTAVGVESIVLDLKRLSWLDAAGVGQLVRTWVAARQGGAVLRLRHLGAVHREMLEVVGLLLVIEVVASGTHSQAADVESVAHPPQRSRGRSRGRRQRSRRSRVLTLN